MNGNHWTCNREFYDCTHRWRWQARLCQWWRTRRTRRTTRHAEDYARTLVSSLGKVRITREYYARQGDRNPWEGA